MHLNSIQCHNLFRNNFTDSLCSLKFKTCPQIDQNVPVILSFAWVKYLRVGQGGQHYFTSGTARGCVSHFLMLLHLKFLFDYLVVEWSQICFQICSELLQSEMSFVSFLALISISDFGFEPKTHKDGQNVIIHPSPHIPLPQVLTVEYFDLAKRCTWKNGFVLNKCAKRHTNVVLIAVG